MDAGNILKPYLEGGELRFMGATTYDEYNQNFIRDKAFSRRFEQVSVPEPSIDECVEILNGIKRSLRISTMLYIQASQLNLL